MQGPERSPINLAFFNADETGIGQTSRRISLIEANGKRSVCVGGLPVYVYEADDNAAEVVCIAMLSCANVADDSDRPCFWMPSEHRWSPEAAIGYWWHDGCVANATWPEGSSQGDG